MSTHRIEAVVFDVDGTLVQSVEQHAEAYRLALEPLGIDVAPMQIFLREGARSESIVREFLEDAGVEHDDDRVKGIADEKQRHYEALGDPEPYDGALDVVRAIHERGFKLGLVTGTKRRNVDRLLPGIVDLCDVIRAQEDYEADKPDPEPYLSAAEALDLDPRHIVVVENAPRGVESAYRAGAHVIAITTTLPRDRLERHADWVVTAHSEVLGILPNAPGGVVEVGT